MLVRKDDGLSEVKREHGPVVCIAGGQSLTQAQVDYVKGRARVIAINAAYLLAPFADMLYFPDARVYDWHSKGDPRIKCLGLSGKEIAQRFREFAGQKCCTDVTAIKDETVHRVRYLPDSVWSDDPGAVARGEHGHSGLQVLQMAANAGGDPIILLGYDAREPGKGERSHWHGDHPHTMPRNVYGKFRSS